MMKKEEEVRKKAEESRKAEEKILGLMKAPKFRVWGLGPKFRIWGLGFGVGGMGLWGSGSQRFGV